MRLSWTHFVGVFGLFVACNNAPDIVSKPPDPPEPVDTDIEILPLPQPNIKVDPLALGFGGRPPSCASDPKEITITNIGEAPLQIDSIEIKGQTALAYEIVKKGRAALQPGESSKVQVVFTPSDYLPFDQARVVITSNDPDEGTVRVDLTGEGSEAEFGEELFVQNQISAVDVVWVLDNSCSMDDKIRDARNHINSFIQGFVNLGLDYRLAITTTSVDTTKDSSGNPLPGAAGAFVDNWMDSTNAGGAAAVITEFERQSDLVLATVGQGSANEQGTDAIRLALTAPLINKAPNQGFVRSDAALAAVVLSDEDDASNGTGNFANWLASLKGGDMSKVSLSGIVGPRSGGGCTFGAAPRYHNMISATGGAWGNICGNQMANVLSFMSQVAAGLRASWPLSVVPLSTSGQAITVEVCSSSTQCVVIPHDAINGWSYDAGTNSINFNGNSIPGPGDIITVTYPVPSTCTP